MNAIILYGIGSSLVSDVEESAHRAGVTIAFGVHNVEGERHLSFGTLTYAPDEVPAHSQDLPILVPLFTPGHRQAAVSDAAQRGFGIATRLIDPTAVLPRSLELGPGTYVNAGCTFGAGGVLGPFALINRGANIGHHVQFGRFVSVGPGAVIAGGVTLGDGALVATGAVILPGRSVGANAVVGAGSIVTRDVDAGCLVVGNPAQVVRRDIKGYNGVSVA